MSKQIEKISAEPQTNSEFQPLLLQPQNLTNPTLKQLNQSYATKIAKGQIQVYHQTNKSKLSAAQQYDKLMKSKKMAQAQKQKQQLQRKLDYLNKSIQTIKEYNYSSGKATSTEPNTSKKSADKDENLKKSNMRKKIKEYQQELQKKKQAQKQRKLSQQQKQIKVKQQQTEAQKEQRKQKISENIQKIKRRIEDRESSSKKQGQEYKKVIQNKTLYQKIEQDYAQRENSILEERKKKLADIRNLHRPISLSEITEHQKTFLEVLKEKEFMRERQRRINNSTEEYKVSYKSPTYKKLAKDEKELKEDESRIKADKMRQFSQRVRDNFIPLVDQRKRQSIEKVLEEEIEKKRKVMLKSEEEKERVQETRSKGLRYLEQIKDLPKNRNSSQQQAPTSERIHYKNYLTHSENSGNTNWRNILESGHNKKQKAIRMQFQAQKLETSLKLRQQKARLLKGDADEIDQEYFDMIKAKLDLLQI